MKAKSYKNVSQQNVDIPLDEPATYPTMSANKMQERRRVRKMMHVAVVKRVQQIEHEYQEARRKFHQRARNREKLRLQIANRKKRKRDTRKRR